jgi:SAM-dependent methyltransferase
MSDYRGSHLAEECPARFDGHYVGGRGHLYWVHFERPYLEALFARLSRERPGRYLDFACGTGRILEIAFPHFPESVGIDVSPVMLSVARRRIPGARMIQADVTVDPPDVGSFTVISLFRFILGAEDPLREGVLRWLRSVITRDGILVLNNHLNRWSLTGLTHWLDNVLHGRRGGPPTDAVVEALLRRCGFCIVERFGFGIIPPWRARTLVPSAPLLRLERRLRRSRALEAYAKDRIYLCRPIEPAAPRPHGLEPATPSRGAP